MKLSIAKSGPPSLYVFWRWFPRKLSLTRSVAKCPLQLASLPCPAALVRVLQKLEETPWSLSFLGYVRSLLEKKCNQPSYPPRLAICLGGILILLLFVFFWLAGRGLGAVQGGSGGCWGGGSRGPSLYAQVGFEAICTWKQHTVLT